MKSDTRIWRFGFHQPTTLHVKSVVSIGLSYPTSGSLVGQTNLPSTQLAALSHPTLPTVTARRITFICGCHYTVAVYTIFFTKV